MLQKTQNMSWRHHMTNQELYGSLPWITTIVRQWRLRLAGHVTRHNETANKVLLWKPDGPRRRGRPTATLQNILGKDTNLSGKNLIAAMKNRNLWKEIIITQHSNKNIYWALFKKAMKGKGKGDRGGDRGGDMKDCPLQFPDLKPVEHQRLCPTYTTVLGRSEEDGVFIDELDMLQTETETLLAAAAKRMRHLEAEINILTTWQEKGKDNKKTMTLGKGEKGKDKKMTPLGKGEPVTPVSGKRSGKVADDKPSKKFKETPSKVVNTPNRAKGKVQHLKMHEFEFPESPKPIPPELPKIPKNDTPNRFWAMVEPYCADITADDLKFLDELIRQHEDNADYYKVPSLGKHFSEKWAQEDLLDEQKEGSRLNDKRSSASSNHNSTDVTAVVRQLENGNDDMSPFGPLTQRLVQALIEENIMTPLDDTAMTEADAAEAASISPRSLAKQLNIGNTAALERRIKRELEENGILEVEDKTEDDTNDEILNELRRKQHELKVISQHNQAVNKKLLKLATQAMHRQDVRRKMAAADAEVMEAFRRIQTARQKKKTPTKKEKEAAMRALKERQEIVRQLEALD
ncbi:Transcriptional adapter 3-B [Lamellibrachia satsuma]|nr:Transcriptional adapter 3-B [Lamellibrachia satsuma]